MLLRRILFISILCAPMVADARRPRRNRHGKRARRAPAAAVARAAHWESRDWQRAVDTLIDRARATGWVRTFRKHHRRKPVVAVYPFTNRSSVYGPPEEIARALRNRLGRERRFKVRHRHSEGGKASRRGKMADFVLDGVYFLPVNVGKKHWLHHHVLALQILDVRSGEKVWLGLHEDKRLRRLAKDPRGGPTITRLNSKELFDVSGDFSGDDGRVLTQNVNAKILARLAQIPKPLFIAANPLRNRSSSVIYQHLLSLRIQAALLASKRARIATRHGDFLDHLKAEYSRRRSARPWRRPRPSATIGGQLTALREGRMRSFRLAVEIADANTDKKLCVAVATIKKVISKPKVD